MLIVTQTEPPPNPGFTVTLGRHKGGGVRGGLKDRDTDTKAG